MTTHRRIPIVLAHRALFLVSTIFLATLLAGCPIDNCPEATPGVRESVVTADLGAVAQDVVATVDGGAVVAGFSIHREPGTTGNDGLRQRPYVIKVSDTHAVEWETTIDVDDVQAKKNCRRRRWKLFGFMQYKRLLW